MGKFGIYDLIATPDGDEVFLVKSGDNTKRILLSQVAAFIEVGGGVGGAKVSKTISSGEIEVIAGKRYAVSPESGSEDDLDQISGLSEGEEVRLYGTSGNTINVLDGANLILQADADCILIGPDDFIQLEGTSVAGVCRETNRMGGEG